VVADKRQLVDLLLRVQRLESNPIALVPVGFLHGHESVLVAPLPEPVHGRLLGDDDGVVERLHQHVLVQLQHVRLVGRVLGVP